MKPSEPAGDERPLYVGQLNTPEWSEIRAEFDGIFDRRFYTNHGPLVAAFERELAERLGVRHAIGMTNGTVALMVAAKAAGLAGKVVVPAFTFPATVQAMTFAGLTPVFCDVDPETHNIDAATVEAAMEAGVAAIAGVHLWGRLCPVDELRKLADREGAMLLFDAAHAFDCSVGDRVAGGLGVFEIFSFHATKVLNCAEGGCVTTNDDALADAIRTARNFHEQQTFTSVPLRINAKMSEAQAAMGLVSLRNIDRWKAANGNRYGRYRDRLSTIDGIRFIDHADGMESNHQYVVIEVDSGFPIDRTELMRHLQDHGVIARRYFYPGMHKATPYNATSWSLPVTDGLCERVLQLPSGDMISDEDIDRVCALIESAG